MLEFYSMPVLKQIYHQKYHAILLDISGPSPPLAASKNLQPKTTKDRPYPPWN